MSQIAFQGNASGTGTFTIAAPNSNTNRTLNIPDASGSLVVDGNNINVPSINGGQLAGMRNKIINGKMEIAQRGTSFANPAGASTCYTVDRWQVFRVGNVSGCTASRQLTGLTEFPFYLQVQRNSADAQTAVIYASQSFETTNISDLRGKSVTLSFWLATVGAATTNGVIASIQYGTGTDGNTNTGFTGATTLVSQSFSGSTWTKYSITGTLPTTATQLAALFQWTPTGTAGASDYFGVTGVQLEVGAVATPFEHRLFGDELMLCQRYYEISSTTISVTGGSSVGTYLKFAVEKRATPTVTRTGNGAFDTGGNATAITTYGAGIGNGANSQAGGVFTVAAEL